DDKKELALERDGEHMALARIVWTRESVERAHLGQLHTALTRYWCETGVEPKGILIISKLRDNGPSESLHDNADKELVEFAKQKNICLLTTVQLLAVYREVALKAGEGSKQRNIILNASGWLEGLDLRPGEEILESEEGGKGKSLSSLLSA
ncbi:MAG: hypothetical protein K2Z81_04735, partial [Cyanobacteria bacterium]|nr:hypothetical protein [Cyanobacteriota bacterium]